MSWKSEKDMEDFLTDSGEWAYKRKFRKPSEPQRLTKQPESNTEVIVNNDKIQTKNDFVKSLPIEDQPGYDPDKDPNLFRRIKFYQGEDLGKEFDRAIAEEDKALKALGRDPANILQRNKNVKPLYPKRATTKQMVELKGKIDKYKNSHFPKKQEQPFTKKKKASIPLPQIKLNLDPIEFPEPLKKDPQQLEMEKRFNELLKKNEEEKIKNQNSGIGYLLGGSKVYE